MIARAVVMIVVGIAVAAKSESLFAGFFCAIGAGAVLVAINFP